MRMRLLSTALAGLTVCFAGVAGVTAQDHPPCVAIAEQSPAAKEAWHQANLVRSRIRRSGFTPDEMRWRLVELGYRPSTLDPHLNPNCGLVPLAADTLRLALEALGLLDGSALDVEPAAFEAPSTVTIAGEVREPGTVAFREGMTLSDLITQAGRLRRTADLTLEVYRVFRTANGERLVIPEIHSIRVDSTYLVNRVAGRIYAAYIPGFSYLVDRAAAFKLRPYDRVVVLALPRYPTPPGSGE